MDFFDEDELIHFENFTDEIDSFVLNSAAIFFSGKFKTNEDKATLEKKMSDLCFRWLKISHEIIALARESGEFDEFQNTQWDNADAAESKGSDNG